MAQTRLDTIEARLIRRVCAGDREAFEELVRPYERLVYLTAISVVGNSADAEEVSQEAILKAFSNLRTFRAESKFSTWLVHITYNEARMKLRKARRHLYESLEEPRSDGQGDYWPRDFADWRAIPSEVFEESEAARALQTAIQSLRPGYREVVILRDLQNLSTRDTAIALGLPEATVKTRLHRARLLLRDALAPGMDGCWRTGLGYRKVRPW